MKGLDFKLLKIALAVFFSCFRGKLLKIVFFSEYDQVQVLFSKLRTRLLEFGNRLFTGRSTLSFHRFFKKERKVLLGSFCSSDHLILKNGSKNSLCD